jgi:uncharacterized protein (UPF0218 family)
MKTRRQKGTNYVVIQDPRLETLDNPSGAITIPTGYHKTLEKVYNEAIKRNPKKSISHESWDWVCENFVDDVLEQAPSMPIKYIQAYWNVYK